MPKNTSSTLEQIIQSVLPGADLTQVQESVSAELLKSAGVTDPIHADDVAAEILVRVALAVQATRPDLKLEGTSNAGRAARAHQGMVASGCLEAEDLQSSAMDALAHLMHWCDSNDVDFDLALQSAYVNHGFEVDEERPAVDKRGKCDECNALVDPEPPYVAETHEQHCSASGIDDADQTESAA
jgi:hypothetical protein